MVVSGVDLEAVSQWMIKNHLSDTSVHSGTALEGGTQNILVQFSAGSKNYVLRRPPLNLRPNSNQTMRREAAMLKALSGSGVPHPALIGLCEDEALLGCCFYIMEAVDGFNPVVGLPDYHAGSVSVRHGMGVSLVTAIARLGELDPTRLHVASLGKPENYLQRQVARWRRQLESYEEFEGWDGRSDLVGIERISDWLETHRPAETKPGILHGDVHLANTLFSRDSADLAALVDWELTTIGDPLIDLGWLLATWPESAENHGTGAVGVTPWNGFPGPEELLSVYGSVSSRDVSAAEWYGVLACFKLGIIQEGTYARACAGKVARDVGDQLHNRTIWLLERALQWVS